jgi:UDP-N-acetyl-2-amino-2-deoxyglucuronate dehydrogenase
MSADRARCNRQEHRLGVGIVGCGIAGGLHAASFSNLRRHTRVVAFADIEEARAERMQRQFHADAAYGDYGDLLEHAGVDVISVCTPPNTHAQVVLDAVGAGKHVLCEKPMAPTLADVDRIVEATSQAPDIYVSCVYQHRDDPAVRQARWMLTQGLIGDVSSAYITAHAHRTSEYYRGWRGRWDTDGGGVLMIQGIHLLDLMTLFLGRVNLVSATMSTSLHEIETEDTFAGWARLENGTQASISCTTCAHRDEYSFDILGDLAGLRLKYRPGWARTWQLCVLMKGSESAFAIRRAAKGHVRSARRKRAVQFGLLAAARVTGSTWRPTYLGHGPHIRRFVDAVESGQQPPVTPSEARRSVELASALYRSASIEGPVAIGDGVMAMDGD